MNVLMLVGSLRADSWSARVARTIGDLIPDAGSTAYADLGALPHYDADLDTAEPPPAVAELRRAIKEADALVVATPEYNGSLPGVLKNAIDWASRPRGDAALAGKPVAVVTASPSPRGAQWAREDTVRILRVAGALPLEDSVQVPAVHEALAEADVDPDLLRQLTVLVADLVLAGAGAVDPPVAAA